MKKSSRANGWLVLCGGLVAHSAFADSPCDSQTVQRVISQCMACHTMKRGEANATGPNLHGVLGRPIGKAKGFSYSADLRNVKGRWDEETLSKFLASPSAVYPGTRMAFGGLEVEEDRKAVVCYFRNEGNR